MNATAAETPTVNTYNSPRNITIDSFPSILLILYFTFYKETPRRELASELERRPRKESINELERYQIQRKID